MSFRGGNHKKQREDMGKRYSEQDNEPDKAATEAREGHQREEQTAARVVIMWVGLFPSHTHPQTHIESKG